MSFIDRLKQESRQFIGDVQRGWDTRQQLIQQRRLERERAKKEQPAPDVAPLQRPSVIDQALRATQPIVEPFRDLQEKSIRKDSERQTRRGLQPRQFTKQEKGIAQDVLDFGKAVLRDIPRSAAQLTLKQQGMQEFRPVTRAERFLFGEEPIKTPERTGEEILRGFGVEERRAERLGGAVGYPLAALGVIPFVGTKKRLARQIAKQGKEDTVKRTITQGIKGVTDEEATILARELTPIKDEKIVQQRLDDFVKAKQQARVVAPTPPELEPLAREARKFESAEEFVRAQPKIYHGSAFNFSHFDEAQRGRITQAPSAKEATFFTSKKEIAQGYAELGGGEEVIKLRERADILEKQAKRTGDMKLFDKATELSNKADDIEIKNQRAGKIPTGQIIEASVRLENPLIKNMGGRAFQEAGAIKIVQQAKKAGHDGVIFRNVADAVDAPIASKEIRPIKEQSDVYAIFDNKDIFTKSQLTDLWHQARRKTPPAPLQRIRDKARAITPTPEVPPVRDVVPPTPVEVVREKARVGARTPRERSLITRVKETAPELKQKVHGQYIPRSTDNLAIKARNLIRDDIVTAERIAREGTDDTSVAVASELMNHYNNLAATAKTEVDRLKFYDRTADIANELAPILTAQGRTIQAAAIYGRMTPEGILRFSARQIQKYNEEIGRIPPLVRKIQGLPDKIPPITGQQTKELVEEARRIIDMPDGENKAMAFHRLQEKIAELTPTPLMRKIISLWKAGLLTGIKTTGLNLSANLFHGVSEVIKDAPAAVVDSVASLFTGKREIAFTAGKTVEGFNEGFRKGWRHLTTGLDERRIGAKLDYKRIHYGNSPVAQALQKYERSIFNIIGAGDQPFYYGAKARAIQSQAIAQAMNKRLRGIEAKNFVDNLVANPTDEMLKNAVGDAETAVFANPTELGRIARQVQEIGGGAGEIVVPFARTPAAVAMQILNYSPIGILRGIGMGIAAGRDFAKIQRQFSMAMGRGITGTAVLGLGSWLYGRDRISLGFPRDERERKQWELEGKQPNSIKVGDKWRQAHLLGPLGLMLIWGGHVRNFYDETGSATATANVTEALARSVSGMAKTFTEQTFVRGVESALGLITDPERNWERSMRTLLGPFGPSAIPTIVSDVARATDPYQRRTGEGLRGIWLDGAMARIPGLRQRLEPRVDVAGQKVERPGTPLEIMIDPTRPLEAKTSPVIAELGRLSAADYKVTPTDFGGRHGFKSLTPEQNTLLEQSAGQRLFTALNDLIISEEYQIMSDEEKAKTIQDFTERARINARAELLKEILYGPGGPQGPALTAKIQELKDDRVLTQGVRTRLLDILQE